MRNDLSHLNDALHRMLDELSEPTDKDGNQLSDDQATAVIRRAAAMSGVCDRIIDTAKVAIEVERLRRDSPKLNPELPRLLGAGGGDA